MKVYEMYELIEEIGQGPRTIVYRAMNSITGQEVAVKALTPEAAADPENSRLLQESAQFLANVPSYNHVLQVYTLELEKGWLIAEFMDASLADRLREGPLPADMVRSVLRQALEGLVELHAISRLHGRLKPTNLLIDDKQRIKIADSPGLMVGGVVRQPDDLPKYTAPELIDPKYGDVGPPTDLYILGFTALELLYGPEFDQVFKGTGRDSVDPAVGWIRLHGSDAESIPHAAELVKGLPVDLDAVINRMLRGGARDRYQSAEEALADLAEGGEVGVVVRKRAPGRRVSPPGLERTTPAVDLGVSGRKDLPPDTDGGGDDVPPEPPAPAPSRLAALREWTRKIRPINAVVATAAFLLLVLALALATSQSSEAEFKLSTSPDGATVTFLSPKKPPDQIKPSGKKTNATYRIHNVPMKVRIALDGYETQEVDINPEDQRELMVELKKKVEPTTSIRIESSPTGATVRIGGDEKGRTPCDVPLRPGSYKVELSLAEHNPRSDNISVDQQTRVYSYELTRVRTPVPGGSALPDYHELRSVKMRLRLIPAGSFRMGSPEGEKDRQKDESLREVVIPKEFYIGIYEVTQEQYLAVLGRNPSVYTKEREGGPNHPVDAVTYANAEAFCKKLSETEGKLFRLPTEAEWEYACRAGTTTSFHCGGELSGAVAVFLDADKGGRKSTAPVGERQPNKFGLYDMHGNVAEWCSDVYGSQERILRGGSFDRPAGACRSAARDAADPNLRASRFGFRIVMEP